MTRETNPQIVGVTPDKVIIYQNIDDFKQPPRGIKYCFSHEQTDLSEGVCDWCGKTVTEIVASELKHG